MSGSTLYPTALDDASTLPEDKTDGTLTATDHAAHHNNLATALRAVEAALGTTPYGANYATVAAAIAGKVDFSPTAEQIILGTGDIVGLTVKATVAQSLKNVFQMRLSNNAIGAYIDKDGNFSAQGLKIAGAALAAANLSNGVTGTGAIVLASAIAGLAALASPTFTGTPAAPTAALDTSTTQIATTAFVLNQLSAVADGTPAMDGAAARGTSTHIARADHVHPTDTTLLPKAGGTLTGKLTVAAAGIGFNDGTTQTTAPAAGVTVVTALPGSPTDGQTVKLRIGASPYRYLVMTYDATYAKWVSDEYLTAWDNSYSISHNTTINTVSSGFFPIRGSDNYAALRAAGLHMQMRFWHRTWNDSASSGVFWINVAGAVSGSGTRHDTQVYTTGFITWSATPLFTGDVAITSWRDIPLSTTFDTDDFLLFYGNIQSNASPNFTTTHTDLVHVLTRWVA